MGGFFKALGLDQYQRAAHLNPAILAVLPVFVTVLLWFPAESKLISGLVSLTASVALAVLLMQFGRARGRAVEARMKARLGGLASTRALRFRDDLIAGETKRRYHTFLTARGIAMPTREQETADPAAADDLYRSACDRLREWTRDPRKFDLLHGENRSYGFRRNLLGLKPLGLTLILLSMIGNGVLTWLAFRSAGATGSTGLMLAALLLLGGLVWIFVVTEAFVEDASRAYTLRLLAACDLLSDQASKLKKAKAAG